LSSVLTNASAKNVNTCESRSRSYVLLYATTEKTPQRRGCFPLFSRPFAFLEVGTATLLRILLSPEAKARSGEGSYRRVCDN
jgi:hypothetical protein